MADKEEAPADPTVTEVEITVAGHTIIVKAAAPLDEVAAQALGLFEQTKLDAIRIPVGFDVNGSQVERSTEVGYVGNLTGWTEERDAGLGRKHPERASSS